MSTEPAAVEFIDEDLLGLNDRSSSEVKLPLSASQVDQWDGQYDLVVVGFGLAGASAALEAANCGLNVLILDRFQGGGSSQMSGGIVYCGGGTHVQQECGVDDSPEAMAHYLGLEVGGLVSDETVRKFCDDSVDTLAFLERHGVNFSGPKAPRKTSFPIDKYYLYYSDNGTAPAFIGDQPPAERGHRTKNPALAEGARAVAGKKPHGGFTEGADVGWFLMTAIKQAVAENPQITAIFQARATRLIVDDRTVVGVQVATLEPGSLVSGIHRWAERIANKTTLQVLGLSKPFAALFKMVERSSGSLKQYRAKSGLLIAAGGYIRNRAMMQRYASPYLKTLPIGCHGDDGAGIRLGASAGGTAGYLDRISAWRFINPPFDWTKGVIIGVSGERIVNEELYGAHLSRAIYEQAESRAWLVLDQAIWQSALDEVNSEDLFEFQNFTVKTAQRGAKKADTLAGLAQKLGVPAAAMESAITAYSDAVKTGTRDPLGKSEACCQAFGNGPFYAISLEHSLPVSPITSISTGGLRVNEKTGSVLDTHGKSIKGLFAAGRSAIGIPSNNYVSGLSLADCVWSGRRAARTVSDQRKSGRLAWRAK